jgi:hypothetical protein
MLHKTIACLLFCLPMIHGQVLSPVTIIPPSLYNHVALTNLLTPRPGYHLVILSSAGNDEDLVAYIQSKGGPKQAATSVVNFWAEGRILSVPTGISVGHDEEQCLAAQQNLQQWQNAVLIAQTYAYGLSVICFATGGPGINPGVCGVALAAQGLVLYAQYQVNQAQRAVATACNTL